MASLLTKINNFFTDLLFGKVDTKRPMDNKIHELLCRAENLLHSNQKEGYAFLREAGDLYSQRGYCSQIERKINGLVFRYAS